MNLNFLKWGLAGLLSLGLSGVSPAQTGEAGNPGWFAVDLPSVAPGWRIAPSVQSLSEPLAVTSEAEPLMVAMSESSGVATEIQDLARALQNDPVRMFDFVHNHIEYVPYFGYLKGPVRTLLDRSGNDLDQAVLLNELLKAAGNDSGKIMFGTMTIPLVETNGVGAANWLGVDTNMTIVTEVLSDGGISVTNQGADVVLERFWVEATHDGQTVDLDPAFKHHGYYPGIGRSSLQAAMGYALTNVLYWSGGTYKTNENHVGHLYDAGLRNEVLKPCTENLLDFFKTEHPNATVEEVLGGKLVVPQETVAWGDQMEWPASGITSDVDPYDFAHKLTLSMEDHQGLITRSYWFPDIATSTMAIRSWKRYLSDGVLTILDWFWDVELDGQPLFTANIRGVGGWPAGYSENNKMMLQVEHPYSSTNVNQTVEYLLPAPPGWVYDRNYFNIVIGFDSSSDQYLRKREILLDKLRDDGKADDSNKVIHETLNIMGLDWFRETALADELVYNLAGARQTVHHRVGVVAQTDGYYIDVKAQMRSAQPKFDGGSWYYPFRVSGMIGSSMEHGVLEQLQGTHRPAASTVKLLKQAGTSSSTNKGIYAVTSSNDWNAVEPSLINYSDDQKEEMEEHLAEGLKLILPKDAKEYVSSWKGLGYIAYDLGTMKMLINGKYGGFCGGKWNVSPSWTQNAYQPKNRWSFSTFHPLSIEPVDMATGHYLHDHTDLEIGGEAPLGLELNRYYNSRHRNEKRNMGYGWSHGYDSYVREISDYEAGLGGRTLADAAPSIVAALISLDLVQIDEITTNSMQIARFWGINSMVNKWWMDQLTQNAAVVHWNSKGLSFTKQPDGSYTPPPGVTAQLEKEDGIFTLNERFGTEVTFGPQSGVIVQPPTGNPSVSLEAEQFTARTPRNGQAWELTSDTEASGGAAMIALPDGGTNYLSGYTAKSPQLDYRIDFSRTSELYVWVRGRASDANADTVHIGLDGVEKCRGMKGFTDIWSWSNTKNNGSRARFTPATGVHTVNVWMAEDGFEIDQIILAIGEAYHPETNSTTLSAYDNGADFKIRSWKDADGNTLTFDYNGETLQAVEDAYGRSLSFNYNADNRLSSVEDSEGREVLYSYDNDGHLTGQTDPEGYSWHYGYDDGHRMLCATNPLGEQTIFNSYNSQGQVTGQVFATGHDWKFYFTGFESIEEDPSGAQTTYYFDSKQRQIGQRDAEGNLTQTRFDGQNHPVQQIDARGTVTQNYYDDAHNLVQVTEAAGTSKERYTLNTYDTQNRLTDQYRLWYWNGQTPVWRDTHWAYDAEHHPVQITDGLGKVTTMTYYGNGLLHTKTDPRTNTTTFVYDSYGNPATVQYANGDIWDYEYNPLGDLLSATDPLNNETVYTYDDRRLKLTETDALGQVETSAYDALGRKISFTDRNTNTTAQTWNAADKLVTITFPDLGIVSNAYDLRDELIAQTDARGNTTEYTLDKAKRIIAVEDALGNSSTNTYDANGNQLTATDPLGNVTTNVYDVLDRLTTVIDPLGGVTQISYDALDNRTAEQDPLGHLTQYGYDELGRLGIRRDALNHDTQYAYDANGNRTAVLDARGKLTQTRYDQLNRPAETIDPLGNSASKTYDAVGNVVEITDARGFTTTNEYNELNRLVRQTDPAGGITQTVYDPNGNVIQTTDARGLITESVFDEMNRMIRMEDSTGAITEYSYDLNGNRLTQIDPVGTVVSNQYDALNQRLSVSTTFAPSTVLTTFSEYDAAGRLDASIDALGRRTEFDYDALGRKTAVHRPDGYTEQYEYDAVGNRTAFVNAKANRWSFGYDALNRLAAETNALGHAKHYSYDAVGNQIQRTDAGGKTTDYQYDALNRQTNIVHEGIWQAAFEYDENGNRAEVRSQESEVSFAYDPLNRLTNSSSQVSSFEFQVSNAYDLNGNRTNLVYPGGLTVAYEYDSENRLSDVSINHQSAIGNLQFLYDSAGRLTNIVYPNGVSGSFGYDGNGEVVAFSYGTASSNFIERAISRNANGFKMYENIAAGLEPAAVQQTSQERSHDDADRLVSTALTNSTALTYSYDNNGNLTQGSGGGGQATAYAYDYENHLTQVSNFQFQVSYQYDASGARVSRSHDSVTNHFVVHYSVDSNVPLAETDAAGNITRYYIWTPLGLVAQIDTVAGGGDPGGTIYYPHSDELGNVIAFTDTSGTVVSETFYSPYGDVWAQSGGIGSPWGLGGAFGVYTETDVELLHMQARYYSPEMKRFISADPTGLKGGVNFYTYADGNPLNAIDPEGLCARPSLFGRTSLFGKSNMTRSSLPSWHAPMHRDLKNQMRYGTSFEDSLRGTMAPAVAAASVFNPSAMARGIANEYQSNYRFSGSHYNAANLTFNPVVRGFLNASQATDGIGYKYHNAGSRLSTGQRIGSGVGAAFNAAEAVGVGYVGAKLTTSLAPSLNQMSFSSRLPTAGRMTQNAPKISNPVPSRMARVVPDTPITRASGTLGRPGASDVFVTAADDIAGMNASQISQRLTIPQSPTGYRVMEFSTPSSGVASPILRTDPGFIGGGRTLGGAREFVIPNGSIPYGANTTVIRP
jgi:RHS repeat-associated protein